MVKKLLETWGDFAILSLRDELDLTPKPGLVDQSDTGAHQDMDYTTFQHSIKALSPYFHAYITIGFEKAHLSPEDLFIQLRLKGIEAEKAMFQATSGINTHKGINFLMAVLLGACGQHLSLHPSLKNTGLSLSDIKMICLRTIPLTQHLETQDLTNLNQKKPQELSHGEKLYLRHGIKGPRGMVMSGFALIFQEALPYYLDLLLKTSSHIAKIRLLLFLMSIVEDGNLIHRGGLDAWKQVQSDSKQLSTITQDAHLLSALTDYNKILIQRNLSPGGSADLLSICFFLEKILNHPPIPSTKT